MNNKEIRIGALLVLDTIFFLLEAIIGYSVQSLALIADSFHMLNDIISLIIALWAVRVKNLKPADAKYTYGWQRAEILGALINAVFLIALCFTIIMDAIQRFFSPTEISNPKLILVVGIAGLLSNGIGLVLFHEHGHSHSHGGSSSVGGQSHSHATIDEANIGIDDNEETPLIKNGNNQNIHNTLRSSPSEVFDYFPDNVVERYNSASISVNNESNHSHSHDIKTTNQHTKQDNTKKRKSMNMEGVFLHVLGDALGNVGVIITALIIWKTNYWWKFYSDPITSLVITLIIFNSALPLCIKSSKILLQATPPYINSDEIVKEIKDLPLVKNIHDFHVWNLNEDILIASLHIELTANCEINLPNNNTTNTTKDSNNNQSINNQNDSQESIDSSNDETTMQIDRKLFLIVVSQVRDILHKFGVHSVTIQPEFPSTKKSNNQSNKKNKKDKHTNNNSNDESNTFGNTSKSICLVDGYTNCDTESCH
ncbi:ZRC1 [Candida pseudojiufengensis]|uniref:ZRC1 n=1 Tax=Candida pseudojiufengensis TaxID=497109 RepID=UPI002225AD5B|nr:ZRC1 [Candida pseudojiufengensis]KAI5964744.1 ZRC1 [Candida pseudojiufengensis]